MIETILNYLNARLATLDRIDTTYCLTERRKREGEAVATIPYAYTGAGEFRPVDVDNGSSAWWRARTGWSKEPVTVVGRAVKQQRGTYPLRLFVLLRRKDSVSDDAMMPARLADDLSELMNFENGDLQLMLNADTVSVRASNADPDTTRTYQEEFSTPVADLHYTLCMVAVDVTVDVTGDYKCWQSECDADPDILRLFNLCDGSVTARLTPEQVDCLDSDVVVNGEDVGTTTLGQPFPLTVVQNGLPVGTWNGTEWEVPPCEDADWTLEDTNGNTLDSGSIPSGGSDVIVAPNASIGINGNAGLFTVPSGSPINIGVEDINGNPTGAFDPNTNSWVIPPCPPSGVSLAVAVSDTTPDIGDTITITATPSSGYTPTNYLFFARQGSTLIEIYSGPNASATWQVTLFGAFEIIVQAVEATDKAWNDETVTSAAMFVTAGLELIGDPFLSNVVPPTYPDISGFGRDGTMVNSPTFVVGSSAPNDGGYVELNGVNQYIGSIGTTADFSFIQNTLQFTVGVWCNFFAPSARNFFIGSSNTAAQRGFSFSLDTANYGAGGPQVVNQRLIMGIYRGVSGIQNVRFVMSQDNVITSTGWNYIVYTMNGLNTGQIYLNGTPVTMLPEIGAYALPSGNSTNVLDVGRIGGLHTSGQIGPFHIYDRELTHFEILQNFNTDRFRYGL